MGAAEAFAVEPRNRLLLTFRALASVGLIGVEEAEVGFSTVGESVIGGSVVRRRKCESAKASAAAERAFRP